MIKQLYIACAGAGKTQLIIEEAIQQTNDGIKVLVVTYTENNQKELRERFIALGGKRSDLFIVKGWYTFLLEEIIRPYQRCIFTQRVNGINFNASHPHKRGNFTIPGRAEKDKNGGYNKNHYFDKKGNVYREFSSKLACNVLKQSKINIYERLEAIYHKIYFDEVQDLAGWDLDLLKYISKSKILKITAVGDFRQTIYHTVSSPKKPNMPEDKIKAFSKMGFIRKDLSESKRSILEICNLADLVHMNEGYPVTESNVDSRNKNSHSGIYLVFKSDIEHYIDQIRPLVLRHSKQSGTYLPDNCNVMNFGESKGLTFDHVLIVPTQQILNFLLKKADPFEGKTNVSKNRAYVAITRARYSVAFIIDEKIEGFKVYNKGLGLGAV